MMAGSWVAQHDYYHGHHKQNHDQNHDKKSGLSQPHLDHDHDGALRELGWPARSLASVQVHRVESALSGADPHCDLDDDDGGVGREDDDHKKVESPLSGAHSDFDVGGRGRCHNIHIMHNFVTIRFPFQLRRMIL